ncbi:hypothetical protein, partial [Salmonella sp. s51944]|uniref:hypothetical protein n=1 Tax=Salmonella sp. s51944 TaxID=3159655 RepID=UPI00397EB33A
MTLNNQVMFVLTIFLLFHCADSWSTSLTCEGRQLRISCYQGSYIDVLYAGYGRDRGPYVCPSPSIHLTSGCESSTSLSKVWNACQGRSYCSIYANNGVFGDPCFGTYKFLRVEYKCRRGYRRVRACEHSDLDIACPSRQRILIIDAAYGRNAGSEVCPHPSIQQINGCRSSSSRSVV